MFQCFVHAWNHFQPLLTTLAVAYFDRGSYVSLAVSAHLAIIPSILLAGKQASKQTNKQTNKQTSKQANKQTSKQANKQTSKQANKQASKQANKQTNKQTSKQANKQTSKQANKQTSKQANKQTSKQASKQASNQANKQTNKHTYNENHQRYQTFLTKLPSSRPTKRSKPPLFAMSAVCRQHTRARREPDPPALPGRFWRSDKPPVRRIDLASRLPSHGSQWWWGDENAITERTAQILELRITILNLLVLTISKWSSKAIFELKACLIWCQPPPSLVFHCNLGEVCSTKI